MLRFEALPPHSSKEILQKSIFCEHNEKPCKFYRINIRRNWKVRHLPYLFAYCKDFSVISLLLISTGRYFIFKTCCGMTANNTLNVLVWNFKMSTNREIPGTDCSQQLSAPKLEMPVRVSFNPIEWKKCNQRLECIR